MRPRAIMLAALAIVLAAPPAEARRRRCREDAPVPVIGRARCHRFGTWDVTKPVADMAISTGFEVGWHRLSMAPRTFSASLVENHVTTASGTVRGTAVGAAHADIGTARLVGELFRVGPVRFGPTIEIGGASFGGWSPIAFAGKSYRASSLLYASFGVSPSAAIPAGPLLLRAEVFTGLQTNVIFTEEVSAAAQGPTRYLFPMTSSGPPADGFRLTDARFRLTPRVSAEVWLDDYWTFGVAGAVDVIYRDDVSVSGFFRHYYDKRAERDPRVP